MNIAGTRATNFVLCVGMIRSGSTWSYNFVIDMLRKAGKHVAAGGYSESFAEWVRALPPSEVGVIKCHSFDKDTADALQSPAFRSRCLFTYRGAGAAIASAIRAFDLDFETQAEAIRTALRTLAKARETGETLALNYDELETKSASAVIEAFLGLKLSGPDLDAVRYRHHRGAVKERLRMVDWNATNEIYRDGRYTFHRESLLHQTHFALRGSERERFKMTPERRRVLDELAVEYQASGLRIGSDFYSNAN